MLPGFGPSLGFAGGVGKGFNVTNIGTATNSTTATYSISSVTVPSGSLIVVGVAENNAGGTTGSVSDSAGNTYTKIGTMNPNNSAAGGAGSMFYCPNCLAVSAGTITYTKAGAAATPSGMSAFYSDGAATAPLDGAVTATATGSSATPSVTSGTPAVAGELFVGLSIDTTVVGFTLPAGWTTPFTNVASNPLLRGGHIFNNGSTALTFNPTLGSTANWAVNVVGFKHA